LTAVTDPAAVVTTTSFAPEVPLGVVIVREVAVFEPLVAATPPIVTEVALDRLVPVMTVDVPPTAGPAVTESEVIVGSETYEKTLGDVEETHPPSATKWIGRFEPVPAGVFIHTEVAVTVSIVAVNDPIFTPRVPVRFVPEISKLVSPVVIPEVVEIDVIVGLPEGQSEMLETSFTATLVNSLPTPGQPAGGTFGISDTAEVTVALLLGLATQTMFAVVNEFPVAIMVLGKLRFLTPRPNAPSPIVVMPSGSTTEVNDVVGEKVPFGS
jgi:hypothetical protein